MEFRRALVVIAVIASMSGCAWVSVKPIAGTDTKTKGFRYYDVKPLLVVTVTNAEIVYVPNYSKAYAVRFGAFLAKHDMKLTITDGAFFKEVDSKQDPAEFLKGLVSLGQEAIKAASSAAKAASGPTGGKLVAIYEFEFSTDGSITGMKPLKVPSVP